MKVFARYRWIYQIALGLSVVIGSTSASDLRIESTEAEVSFRKNLMRAHLGATSLHDGLDLRDDPSRWSNIPAGKTEWEVDLGSTRVLDRFSMQYRQLGGVLRLQVAASSIDPEWELLGEEALKEREAPAIVELSLRPIAGRYVKLSFASETAGAVRALGLFGPLRCCDFQRLPKEAILAESTHHPAETDPVLFSLANGVSWARIVRASHGEGLLHRLRDEDVATSYRFLRQIGKGVEAPSFVLDLGIAPEIGRLVILHDDVPGEWLVAPAEDNASSRTLPAVGGVTVVDGLGMRSQRLHFYWQGDVPPEGIAVHELAIFLDQGLPVSELASRLPWTSRRERPTLPGLGKLPVGGITDTGLPEIEPESP